METIRRETFETVPFLSEEENPDETLGAGESIEVVQYEVDANDDQITVYRNDGDTTTDRYNFQVLQASRQCRFSGTGSVPFSIQLCLASFGFVDVESPSRIIGQYEYLLDAGGWLEERARGGSEFESYAFEHSADFLFFLAQESIAETELDRLDMSKTTIAEESGLPDGEMVEIVTGTMKLKELPKSTKTKLPERLLAFDESGEETEIARDENVKWTVAGHPTNEKIEVILSSEDFINYYLFDGQLGGSCTYQVPHHHELPGPLVVDLLESEHDTRVVNLPRIRGGDSDIDLINKTLETLESVEKCEFLPASSENVLFTLAEALLKNAKVFRYAEQAMGEAYMRERFEEVLDDRTEQLSVEQLDAMGVGDVDVVAAFAALTIMGLDSSDKEQLRELVTADQFIPISEDESSFEAFLRTEIEELTDIDLDEISRLSSN